MGYFCIETGSSPKENLLAAKCNINLFMNKLAKDDKDSYVYLLEMAICGIEDAIKKIDKKK